MNLNIIYPELSTRKTLYPVFAGKAYSIFLSSLDISFFIISHICIGQVSAQLSLFIKRHILQPHSGYSVKRNSNIAIFIFCSGITAVNKFIYRYALRSISNRIIDKYAVFSISILSHAVDCLIMTSISRKNCDW